MFEPLPHDELEAYWEAQEKAMFPPLSPEEYRQASEDLAAMIAAAEG